MRELNLLNVDCARGVKHKTRQVIEYINSLEPLSYWDFEQVNKFEAIKKKALSQTNPNTMLRIIGYRFNKVDEIYRQEHAPQKR